MQSIWINANGMFWNEKKAAESRYQVPDDIGDLVFQLRGQSIEIDHAYTLAQALRKLLSAEVCDRIGVHGIRLAASGNGWLRPSQADAEIPLSRRARLVIRAQQDQFDALRQLSRQRLQLGGQTLDIGEFRLRKLSTLGTLHARAIRCAPQQSEAEFMLEVAAEIEDLGVKVGKMICGTSGWIRVDDDTLFTRSLMIADLEPEESVKLQQHGVGNSQFIGCGIFVPHRGIDAVDEGRK